MRLRSGNRLPSPATTPDVSADRAFLSSLPVELQSLVAEHTFLLDKRCREDEVQVEITRTLVYENFSERARPRCPTLEALSRVSVTFAKLCATFLWEEVDLKDSTESDLEYFVRCVVPRHAQHIRKIVNLFFRTPEKFNAWIDRRYNPPPYILDAVSFPPSTATTYEDYLRLILSPPTLPRLTEIDVHFNSLDRWEEKKSCAILRSAFIGHQHTLRTLSLTWSRYHTPFIEEADFTDFLCHFRNLTSLSLTEIPVVRSSEDISTRTLVDMTSLRSLKVEGCDWFDGRYTQGTWKSALTELHLREKEKLRWIEASDLVSQFSDTLEVLALSDLEEPQGYDHRRKSFSELYREPDQLEEMQKAFVLPYLKRFTLGTYHDEGILQMFKLMPVEELTIDPFVPDFLPLKAWEKFIVANKRTLRLVRLTWYPDENDVEAWQLFELCDQLGIQYRY